MLRKTPIKIRTFEIFASLALCVLCCKFALGVIWVEVNEYKMSQANTGLALLAEQMIPLQPTTGDRSIASEKSSPKDRDPSSIKKSLPSEGTIGNDPWGRPYAFKYFRNEDGVVAFLVLISGGKNSQIETKFADLNLSQMKGGRYIFNGDDFGFIKKIDN